MKFFVVCMILVCFYDAVEGNLVTVPYPEEARMDTGSLISKYGYPLEMHYVTTEDGYILKVQRIPFGSHCEGDRGKKPYPIIATHGLGASSRVFVLTRKGFPFLAADHCYDVWLPNTRGNYDSRNHTFLNPNEEKFWEFDFYEKGVYDIPAVIDYVLYKTNAPQVQYLGHSEGNSISFILASLYPEYCANTIRSIHAIAPVAFTTHSTSPLFTVASSILPFIQHLLKTLGIVEFPRSVNILPLVSQLLCRIEEPAFLNPCALGNFIESGYSKLGVNATTLLTFLGFTPSGSSVREMLLGAQWQLSGNFSRYNFYKDNEKVYGQPTPPEYPIDEIRVPIYLYVGKNDIVADPADAKRFYKFAPTAIKVNNSKFANFNHVDFMIGNNADVVSLQVLENMSSNN